MSEAISWSLSAGGASGPGISSAGQTEGDATVSLSKELDIGEEKGLAVQVDDVDKVTFLAIDCDLLDGSVTVKATADDPTALKGPILLYGEAVKLFGDDLTTLTVKNNSTEKKANLTALIGLTV